MSPNNLNYQRCNSKIYKSCCLKCNPYQEVLALTVTTACYSEFVIQTNLGNCIDDLHMANLRVSKIRTIFAGTEVCRQLEHQFARTGIGDKMAVYKYASLFLGS